MILATTHAKLTKKNATIYRVDVPANTLFGITIPAHHEHFAELKAANTFRARYPGLFCTVVFVPAAEFNPFLDR